MPYISTDKVRNRRQSIRKMFPDYKISVRTHNYSSIHVTVKSGPLDLLMGACEGDRNNGYEQVNHYHYGSHYEDYPEKVEFLDKIMEVINRDNGTESYDGDYGRIPNFYVSISIGDWNKPYIQTKK